MFPFTKENGESIDSDTARKKVRKLLAIHPFSRCYQLNQLESSWKRLSPRQRRGRQTMSLASARELFDSPVRLPIAFRVACLCNVFTRPFAFRMQNNLTAIES
jgi:hypothetical protein